MWQLFGMPVSLPLGISPGVGQQVTWEPNFSLLLSISGCTESVQWLLFLHPCQHLKFLFSTVAILTGAICITLLPNFH
jgi:hypothetical protein